MSLCLVGSSPKVFTYSAAHCHEYYEVILNLEGIGVSSIGGETYPFEPGTIHIIPPNTAHHKESACGFQDVYFQTDTLTPDVFIPCIPVKMDTSPIILSDDSAGTLEKLIQLMLLRYLQAKRNDAVLDSMYTTVMHLLNERIEISPNDPVVDSLIHRLSNAFNDPELRVTDILMESGYNKDYIRRRFQSATNLTPFEYLTQLRIRYAQKLLRQQKKLRLSVTDIGMMSGYYDVRYFSRIFKQQTGISPTEYIHTCENERTKA